MPSSVDFTPMIDEACAWCHRRPMHTWHDIYLRPVIGNARMVKVVNLHKRGKPLSNRFPSCPEPNRKRKLSLEQDTPPCRHFSKKAFWKKKDFGKSNKRRQTDNKWKEGGTTPRPLIEEGKTTTLPPRQSNTRQTLETRKMKFELGQAREKFGRNFKEVTKL